MATSHVVRKRGGRGAGIGLALAGCLVAGAGATHAQGAPCPSQVFNQDLVQPRVIRPVGGVIDTGLTVQQRVNPCVPVWVSQDSQGNKIADPHWEWRSMTLRTYGSPADGNNPNDPNLVWTSPGPTFRARQAMLRDPLRPPGPDNPQVTPGTRLRVLLRNQLPNSSYPYHDCNPATVQEPPPPGSQTGQTFPQVPPDCFHGPEVTNIHYHGTHVSPQPHHDFILLELYSSQQTNPPPPPPDQTHAVGEYQSDLVTFPWNQAPGTHWYHPHKHGSTALQVLNGLSGALVVEGPIDDWLFGLYKVDPRDPRQVEAFEKVMVVHQMWPELNFYHKPHPNYPPSPLVNGQADPVIKMKHGEVQRWRFIGATMQASAQLTLCFPAGFTVKQMAQDGVQFAPENWARQPQLDANGCLDLAPGNRADFLVQAPPLATSKALGAARRRVPVTFSHFGTTAEDVREHLRQQRQERMKARGVSQKELTAAAATPTAALFTVELQDEEVTPPMALPCPWGPAGRCADWPPMPYYLRDIADSEVVQQRTVAFSMTDPATGIATSPGKQPSGYWINQEKYQASCANQTMVLGTAEDWTVSNDSAPNHPFHIHTNPFQVRRNDTTTFTPPYVWQDVIALPTVTCQDANAGPILDQQQAEATCPGVCAQVSPAGSYTWNGQWRTTQPGTQSVCGCCQGAAVKSVDVRHRFEDYTGGYVIHCHFLGHEDRGMMHNVQTVCPGGQPNRWTFGQPTPDGQPDDYKVPSSAKPLPACPPYGQAKADAHAGHAH